MELLLDYWIIESCIALLLEAQLIETKPLRGVGDQPVHGTVHGLIKCSLQLVHFLASLCKREVIAQLAQVRLITYPGIAIGSNQGSVLVNGKHQLLLDERLGEPRNGAEAWSQTLLRRRKLGSALLSQCGARSQEECRCRRPKHICKFHMSPS